MEEEPGPELTDTELARIDARAISATTGPWRSFVEGRDHLAGDDFIRTGGDDDASPDMYVDLWLATSKASAPAEDLDFIAAARQDVPRLVAEVRRLRIELSRERTGASQPKAAFLEPPGNWGVVQFPGRHSVTDTINVGNSPWGVAVDPATGTVYESPRVSCRV